MLITVSTVLWRLMFSSLISLTSVSLPSKSSTYPTMLVILFPRFSPNAFSDLSKSTTLLTSPPIRPTVTSLSLKLASVASAVNRSVNTFLIASFVSALMVTNSFTILSTVSTVSCTKIFPGLISFTSVSAPRSSST